MTNRDPDSEYLAGCIVSSLIAFLILGLSVGRCLFDAYGPKTVYTNSGLTMLVLQCAIPGLLITFSSVWKFGTAAFTGSVGGWACGAAYWFLHLQQSIAKAPVDTGKQTEYLDSTMWLVPVSLFLGGFAVAILASAIRHRTETSKMNFPSKNTEN